MALDRDPNHVFRDFVTDGLPSSGTWNPRKPEIRQLLTEWWQTLIALVADAGGLELPNLLIRYEVTGGDENNIVAEANLPVPSSPGVAVFSIVIEEANTGPVTINGKPLLSNTGNPLAAGALAAEGIYLFLDNGDSYRLLSDYVSSSIVAAAEAAAVIASGAAGQAVDAAERAETFAAGVEFPVSFAPQTLTPEQQEQARTNIAALSYDEQTLTPTQKERARENIAALSYEEQTLTTEQQQQVKTNLGLSLSLPRVTIQHIRTGSYNYDRIVISNGGPDILKKMPGVNFNAGNGQFQRQSLREYCRVRGYRVAINCDADNSLGGGLFKQAGLAIFDGVAYQNFDSSDEWTRESIIMQRDGMLKPARYTDGKTAQDYVNEGALWSAGWGPLLVVGGVAQNISWSEVGTVPSARTVLGQRANGDYVILLIEGETGAYGIAGSDLTSLCISEGLVNAMNLDGGGSTQCWWDTAYAHPSSDDQERARGHHLVIDLPGIPTYDTGRIALPTVNTSSGDVVVSQVGHLIHVEVSVSGSFATNSYTKIVDGVFPKRFWPAIPGYGRNQIAGQFYRPASIGFGSPINGDLYVRAVIDTETTINGTLIYRAKWTN